MAKGPGFDSWHVPFFQALCCFKDPRTVMGQIVSLIRHDCYWPSDHRDTLSIGVLLCCDCSSNYFISYQICSNEYSLQKDSNDIDRTG